MAAEQISMKFYPVSVSAHHRVHHLCFLYKKKDVKLSLKLRLNRPFSLVSYLACTGL